MIFRRDNSPTQREQINDLLDAADTGSEEPIVPAVVERQDLYDSDRTMILRKLASDENKLQSNDGDDERTNTSALTVEQLQRRMKAFALTKRMKRVQEQRSAVYGIMAIEKERQTDEHFALHESDDVELGQSESGNKR